MDNTLKMNFLGSFLRYSFYATKAVPGTILLVLPEKRAYNLSYRMYGT
jgi:hypothetical protein